jgi:hypothetical protein
MMVRKTLRCALLLCVVAAFAALAPAAMAAPPELVGFDVSASCAPNPVPGGTNITCSYSVTNNNTSTQTCDIRGTFFEAGVKQEVNRLGVPIGGGSTLSGSFQYRTHNTGGQHGGTFDLRVTCAEQNGRQTTRQVRFTVT